LVIFKFTFIEQNLCGVFDGYVIYIIESSVELSVECVVNHYLWYFTFIILVFERCDVGGTCGTRGHIRLLNNDMCFPPPNSFNFIPKNYTMFQCITIGPHSTYILHFV